MVLVRRTMRDKSRFLCAPNPCEFVYSWMLIEAFMAFACFACSIEAKNINEGLVHGIELGNTHLLQTKLDVQTMSKVDRQSGKQAEVHKAIQNSTKRPGSQGTMILHSKPACTWHMTSVCSTKSLPRSEKDLRSCSNRVPLSEVGFCDCNGDGVQQETEQQFDCFSTPGRCNTICEPQEIQIPRHIIMTGGPSAIKELPTYLQHNVGKTTNLNPGFQIRYFGDKECLSYIQKYYDEELSGLYMNESEGAFRGDICRGAVLYREGGFYVDLDLELATPLLSLVDRSTKFMSAFDSTGLIYNAFMAVVPSSPVMEAYLRELREFYQNFRHDRGATMGPFALYRALKHVMVDNCPEKDLKEMGKDIRSLELHLPCGQEHYRLYRESEVMCDYESEADICPLERREWAHRLASPLHYGLFDPSSPGPPRALVAWSRVMGCTDLLCGSVDRSKLFAKPAAKPTGAQVDQMPEPGLGVQPAIQSFAPLKLTSDTLDW